MDVMHDGLRISRLATAVRIGLLVGGLGLLTACGGGGGGGNVRVDPPPTAPPPQPVVSAPRAEFSKHLLVTNTAPAHAAGLTGQGVIIGVVDSGVMRSHPALSPRVIANLNYVSSPPNNLAIDDVVGHGTAVSQIMAGRPFGEWPGGIAPGASIVSARIISDQAPTDDGSGQGNEVDGALGLKSIHQDLINRGARIMNNSWGGLYWTNLTATAPIADEYRPFIISNNGLVVFATGNSSLANPSSMAALPSQPGQNGTFPAADLERGWIAVAALDTDNPTTLASYSNACGVAKNYCISAPGKVVVTGTNDGPTSPTYFSWTGTSLAAPLVSGAAALVWQAYPYFNNDLLRQTLLGTATDLGAPGADATFGYGSLNVGKAVLGPAKFDWGTVDVSINSGSSIWSNAISGTGGLIKRGAGTLVLGSGSNSYTGNTQVMGGTLSARESGLPGNVSVASGATLAMATPAPGALRVGGNLDNSGLVKLAPEAGLVVQGNYRHAAGSQLSLYVGNVVTADTATLQGGDLQVGGVKPGYTSQARENMIVTSNGLTGTFASVSQGPGVFLTATPGYDATKAWLDITRLSVTGAAVSMGLTPMSVGSAERIEGAFQQIDRTLTTPTPGVGTPLAIDGTFLAAAGEFQRTESAAAAERSLASLSGELHSAGDAMAMMAIENNRHALESRFDQARSDKSRSTAAAGAWAEGLSGQRSLWSHVGFDAQGWVIGQDYWLGDRLMVGAAMAQTEAYAQHELRRDRERSRQLEGQMYAAWDDGVNYVLGRTAFGHVARQTQREIFLGAESFGVDADYGNRYTTVGVQTGHRFGADGRRFTPYAGVQSVKLQRGAFNENGAAGFGLSTADSEFSATQAMFGGRFDYDWSAGATRFNLHGFAEWQRRLAWSGSDIAARFTAFEVWSPITGDTVDRNVGVFGFGFSAQPRRGGVFGLNLDARSEGGQTYGRAFASWRVTF